MERNLNKKLMLKVNIINGRIWLPKDIQKSIKDEFILVKIKEKSFITKLTKDGRFFIPKEIRILTGDGKTDVSINIIKNLARTEKIIKDGCIDVLAFVPKKTISGYNILALEEKRELRLWYSTKGRPDEMKVNRFLPLGFITLLGYYQAEGGKIKLKKRRGREINFTNTNLRLIEDFLKYSTQLFDISLFKATINKRVGLDIEEISRVKEKLFIWGIKKENIQIRTGQRIKNFTVRLWISNSLLAEIIDSLMNYFRAQLSEEIVYKELVGFFLQGLLAGDGSFTSSRDKNGSLHSYLRVYEGNYEYIKDYQKMIDLFLGVTGKIRKEKKNMYQYYLFANWSVLLKMLEHNLWCKVATKQQKLIETIKNHRNFKFGWLKEEKLLEQVKSFQITR